MIWLSIFLMGILVFSSRYVFLDPSIPLKLGPRFQRFLSFTAPAVLTSIWAPIVFLSDIDHPLLLNPYVIGALVTATISYFAKSVLIAAIIGVISFFFVTSML